MDRITAIGMESDDRPLEICYQYLQQVGSKCLARPAFPALPPVLGPISLLSCLPQAVARHSPFRVQCPRGPGARPEEVQAFGRCVTPKTL